MKQILPLFLAISMLAVASIAQPPPPPGVTASLLINEVDYDQPGTDTAEFVEFYNYGTGVVNMNQVYLILINGANSMAYDTIFFPTVTVAAGDYYVFCGSDGNVANCDFMDDDASDIVQNGSPDAMILYDGFENVVLDALSYEGDVAGAVEGSGVATNMGDNNDDNMMSLSRYPNGTDTDDNSADFALAPSTPGAVNSQPVGISASTESRSDFIIYPNPVQNELNLFLTGIETGARITISNMIGKELRRTVVESKRPKLNTSLLPEGVYFVSVETVKGKVTKRFIKK